MDWTDGPPLLFEALPSPQGTDLGESLDRLAPLRDRVTAVNVPEVLGGAFDPVEPRVFAAALQERLDRPAIVNRITVHHAAEALRAWLDETHRDFGIDHFLFVGGESHAESYPGLDVTDALRLATPHPGTLGVVTIPTRRRTDLDEPQRLLAKQHAGADHAVSQILLEADHAAALRRDAHAAGATLPLVWSVAPVARRKDLAFLDWLGVHVPRAVGAHLRSATTQSRRLERSHELNEAIVRALLEQAEQEPGPAVGVCVEHVMQTNVEAAVELVDRVRGVLREFRGLKVEARA